MSIVRTRIAPSPTGIAHIGTAYMALFNYAFAHKHGGEFIVRIEDTDRKRFVEGAEQVIYDALYWLNIPHTEGADIGGPYSPYRQSERLRMYTKAAQELVDKGHAYYCFCDAQTLDAMRTEQQARKEIPRYDRRCLHLSAQEIERKLANGEPHVIRMKMPDNEIISWNDLIRGFVEINTKELDDQVLMKSDGFPTYHLGVVVDDHDMKITHVIRGEEWISSTPKHILLYQYFGWELPQFAHMPLLRNPDKTKMSKRKNDVSIPFYKEKGYIADALRNYLCLLGWSHPQEKDIFSLDEFISAFTMERMQKTGPVFDIAKLNWMNGKYIREVLTMDELMRELQSFLPSDFPKELLPQIVPLVRDRLVTLADIESLTDFFYRNLPLTKEALIPKKTTVEEAKQFLQVAIEQLEKFDEKDWVATDMETAVRNACDARGWNRGAFFMTLRVGVTGKTVTPPLFDTIQVLGKEKTLKRLHHAMGILAA
ncbi:glutamate--tRNA ligase [Candidatus Cerribacteria bacterium 'Amazon FNV 2010 28 9']|uniref:Glutamate--tRNA ligase n=1 Tax=Candidatus Cerribacteria bacterium 'Amazon FNV 2010 28 9' TaxID=2081795 RepID=A0A317JPZ9_9BACT|nr:MAG: glutamate--tRNA ligase [Candidatus Cerribacteria bacterium 'Amazon FNV 2010 28 9']